MSPRQCQSTEGNSNLKPVIPVRQKHTLDSSFLYLPPDSWGTRHCSIAAASQPHHNPPIPTTPIHQTPI